MAVGGIASSFEPLVLVVVAGPQGQHLGWALSICVGLALYSLLAALILAKLDKDAEVDEIKNGLTKKVEVEKFSMNDLKQLTTLFWLLNIDDLFLVAASMSFMQFFMGFYTTVYNITSGYAGKYLKVIQKSWNRHNYWVCQYFSLSINRKIHR